MHHAVEECPEEHVGTEPREEASGQQALSVDEILLPVRARLGQDHGPQADHREEVEHEAQDACQSEDSCGRGR